MPRRNSEPQSPISLTPDAPTGNREIVYTSNVVECKIRIKKKSSLTEKDQGKKLPTQHPKRVLYHMRDGGTVTVWNVIELSKAYEISFIHCKSRITSLFVLQQS